MRVPRVLDYSDAKWQYDTGTPIRGRVPEVRPLGERRDVDTYSIRMNGDDVELVLYKTPVITFRTNGEVVIRNDGWASVSTHQFITRVLGLPTRGKGGSSVIKVGKQDYTMTDEGRMVLCREGTGTWIVLEHERLYGYKANRKAITNVRSRYSEFRKYLGGFLNLRREEVVLHQGRPYEQRLYAVRFNAQEAVDLFGVKDSTYHDVKAMNREKIDCIMDKPTSIRFFNPTEKQKQEYRDRVRRYEENMKAFTDTIVNGQPEDVRHMNFYRGAMAFMVEEHVARRMHSRGDWVLHNYELEVVSNVDRLVLAMDEAILKYHAEEVLEQVQLNVGKTPNRKYFGWVSEKV